jgi:hypothetical protein
MAGLTGALTGGLIDTGTPDYGKLAGQNEKKRQALINLGMQQINAVYGGGQAPFYSLANPGQTGRFDPHSSYYSLTGRGISPYWVPDGVHPSEQLNQTGLSQALSSGGGDLFAGAAIRGLGIDRLFGNVESPRDIAAKNFRRGQLFNAPTYETFEGFQPAFFQKRAQDYINYALPQLGEQYRGARNATLYGLANRGLQDSTVAGQANRQLERTTGVARQNIADTGLAQANQLKRDVEGSRQEAIRQLYQSANPADAFRSATESAASFRQPSTFAPIANLFSNLAQQYATNQILNNYRAPYGLGSSIGGTQSDALGGVYNLTP